jgi:hypothetical protein
MDYVDRGQGHSNARHLVDKYRAIFGRDVPEVDEALSQRLIVKAVPQALDELERQDVATIGA